MRGRDKLLEDVDGQALLRLMVARARKAGASAVRVVLAEGQTDRAAELRDFTDIEIIHLPEEEQAEIRRKAKETKRFHRHTKVDLRNAFSQQ